MKEKNGSGFGTLDYQTFWMERKREKAGPEMSSRGQEETSEDKESRLQRSDKRLSRIVERI